MFTNYFIQELEFDLQNQIVPNEVDKLIRDIGVDKVHCSGEFPAIFFKEVPNFDYETLQEISELHKRIWNNSSVVFLYVVSPNEIRIYNCNSKPVFFDRENSKSVTEFSKVEIESCKKSDSQKLSVLSQVFSASAIDSGKVWTSDYSSKIKLQAKVDRFLVSSLLKLAKILKQDLDDDVIHCLLMRSLFVMYLQDRKAIPNELWGEFGKDDFLEILNDPIATYKLFENIVGHFNGNVFPVSVNEKESVTRIHLNLIKHCLYDGNIDFSQPKLFSWRLFDFSLIRIELLSEIYENFLNEFDPIRKKETGTYYTPPSLVDLVLENVLPKTSNNYKIKIIDFACGSGIFLAQAYKRIVNNWQQKHSEKELSFKILSEIMQYSIYGVELDPNSIKVAAFSLYLALLDFLDPRDVWLSDGDKFPHLLNDNESKNLIDISGSNLFRADTLNDIKGLENIKFDIVVGNPPFGTKNLPENIKNYCEKYSFDKQFVIPFIHKSVQLCPDGKIALLFNTKLLTNTKQTAQNFRNWLFNDNYVEKIYNLSILRKAPKDFGGQLFSSATVPVSIICFQKKKPKKPASHIEYWAPKTFIKNHVAEGVLVDSSDIKYLPREICQQADTKIWKIAQWGTMADYFLIEKFSSNSVIGDLFKEGENGVGLQTLDRTTTNPIINEELKNVSFILPERIDRYYTNISNTGSINVSIKTQKTKELYLDHYNKENISELPLINIFRRIGIVNAYKTPHIVIKEGLLNKRVCASFMDYDCSFNSKIYGIHHHNISLLKALTCYLNSKVSTYFLFFNSSSWGIEREEIKPTDIKLLPQIPTKSFEILGNLLDKIIKQNNAVFQSLLEIEDQIDNAVFDFLKIDKTERILIEDMINYSLSLLFEGANSLSLSPISYKDPETLLYSESLAQGINDFLKVGDYKVYPLVYPVTSVTPLCMVVLKFINKEDSSTRVLMDTDSEFQRDLKKVNGYTLEKYSQNIYIRKQVRYYDDDTIFIVKPNQKRFWTRSQAIDDSTSIINELIAMDNGE